MTDLTIPDFCATEITDDARFSNDGLADHPFGEWAADFDQELKAEGPRFLTNFDGNRES